ncbi:alcohol dehydrogenase catalytic domain-containing protein [Tunturiibacter psychrotolerans]|uniref:alcohol dehydrogenase catalytic domain-containing protein n=1 Tax=Tunturiibacter psychrotolerans TaxID=3069686 RepID=UPI003DA77F9E
MYEARGYSAKSSSSPLEPFSFRRRDLRENDLLVDILYSGVYYSDLHTACREWHGTVYANGTIFPSVPGHEIVGPVRSGYSE